MAASVAPGAARGVQSAPTGKLPLIWLVQWMSLVVVTAIDLFAATSPKLSVAPRLMVSDPVVASVSFRVARSALTTAREPVIVRPVVPEPLTPVPVADKRPLVSVSVVVNFSPLVEPLSERLTPEMAFGWMSAMVTLVGAATAGTGLMVTAMAAGAPTPVRLSDEVMVMVSTPLTGSVSLRVARSALTCATVPVIERLTVPEPVIVPDPLTARSPAVSARVTVTVWPASSAVASETETPETAPAWPCWMTRVVGAATAGGAKPSVAPTTNWSAKPKSAVAEVAARVTWTSSGWLELKAPASTALLAKNASAADSEVKLSVAVAAPLTVTVKARLEKSLVSPMSPVTLVPARPTIRWPEMTPLSSVKSSVLVKVCEPLVVSGTYIPSVAAPNTAEKEAPRPLIAPGLLAAAILALAPKTVETKLAF